MASYTCAPVRATCPSRRSSPPCSQARRPDETALRRIERSLADSDANPPWWLLLFPSVRPSRPVLCRVRVRRLACLSGLEMKKFTQASPLSEPHILAEGE